MNEVQAEIETLLEELTQGKRIHRHLEQLKDQLDQSYYELQTAEKKLQKEFGDIEKLENISLKGLFHKVLGSKEEQMEKERQEYLQASLKFDEAKKSTELLEFERGLLEKKSMNLKALEIKMQKLLKIRERELIEGNTRGGKKILDILLRIDGHAELASNLTHIVGIGDQALQVLGPMINHLQKARNWGQWDMAPGSRNTAGHMKHTAIDKARDMSYQVKHLLARYQSDLRQIYRKDSFDLNIHFDSFSRFTDIFFDNLISDWIIQQKIQNALANVTSARDRVTRINQSLQVEIAKSKAKMEELEQSRRDLIFNS